MTVAKNMPIAYDYHGDIPFSVPFSQISPKDIHVYLDLDTKTGKNTCEQNCSHCWFVNYEKVHNKSFDLIEGKAIKDQLTNEGYKVFARYVDSFALQGNFMKIHGPAHNREFRQENDHKPTETMKKGDAWTSGKPLLAANYMELLDLARDSGYGTISITFHGLVNNELQLEPHFLYPIKGVFSGANTEIVLQRINEYNSTKNKDLDPVRVNIGLTIGKHNHTKEQLIHYAKYFNTLGINTLRFNNFTDHGGRHPDLPLNRQQTEQFYRDLKWLHENIELNYQLAVSEDFGSFGIEVMEFPKHVGWCRAGKQLFTVIPTKQEEISNSENMRIDKIGDIVACVNIFEPYLGALLRNTDLKTKQVTYKLAFDHNAIDEFSRQRTSGVYSNGCFAKEMLLVKKPALTAAAKSAAAKYLEHTMGLAGGQ